MNKETTYLKPNRIIALTDGIYAFAMTILVLNIDVPDIKNISELPGALFADLPTFYAYLLSFILLAVFWVLHHKLFDVIEKVYERYIWLNIYNLMFIVFIPFSTQLISDYGDAFSANLIFNANMFIAGLFNYLLWKNADKHNLFIKEINHDKIHRGINKSLVVPFVSVLAILLSFFTPGYSSMVYLSIPAILNIGFRNK